jgi:hypothetical protein
LTNGTLFASLISDVELDGFNLQTGKATWTLSSSVGEFDLSAAGGNLVCVLLQGSAPVVLTVQCFAAGSGASLWSKKYAGFVWSFDLGGNFNQ